MLLEIQTERARFRKRALLRSRSGLILTAYVTNKKIQLTCRGVRRAGRMPALPGVEVRRCVTGRAGVFGLTGDYLAAYIPRSF